MPGEGKGKRVIDIVVSEREKTRKMIRSTREFAVMTDSLLLDDWITRK